MPIRAVVLLALLLGPLWLGELWARGQLDRLYPALTEPVFWPDAKLLLLGRAGCPQVLGLGSSVTNRTLVSRLAENERLDFQNGEARVQRVFAFGLNGARMTHLYGAWRRIHAGGCTPPYVFIEVLPGLLNGRRSNRFLLTPFLDTVRILEAMTSERLLLSRLRGPLLAAFLDEWEGHPVNPRERALPLDGMIRPLSRQDLLGGKFAAQRVKRLRLAETGEYRVRPSMIEIRALRSLVDEARAAGSRVILHSPPVTAIYHEIVDQTDGHRIFCRLREAFGGTDELVEWYWSYDGKGFGREHFMDWNHLNSSGGELYIRRLFRAVRNRDYPESPWCGEVLARASAL